MTHVIRECRATVGIPMNFRAPGRAPRASTIDRPRTLPTRGCQPSARSRRWAFAKGDHRKPRDAILEILGCPPPASPPWP
eukprot:1810197-Heterocapsa_arctica.AAC.1